MRILVDAMGGDNAPAAVVQGALDAHKKHGVDILLVGRAAEVLRAVEACGEKTLPSGVEIRDASEVVEIADDPAIAFKVKKDSSLTVGMNLLKAGVGDAFVSAGSTGALLAGATLLVKRIKGIRRAALGPSVPILGGHITLCDCGANAECTPEFLLQFGLVGSAYAKKKYGIENPKVGLLNIGTEDSKGTQLQRDAYALLTDASQKGLLNFVGNVEARGVPLGDVDVVVCDGFSGNVLLKSIEGTAMFVGSLMKQMFKRNVFSKLGYLLCSSGVKQMMKLLDYHEIGGTQLLGIKKPVIKAHGASDRLAFRNAVKQAMDAAENDITQDLEQALALLAQSKEQTND